MTQLEIILIVALVIVSLWAVYLYFDRDDWKVVARSRAQDLEVARATSGEMRVKYIQEGARWLRNANRRDLLALSQFRKMQRDIERTIKRIDEERGA